MLGLGAGCCMAHYCLSRRCALHRSRCKLPAMHAFQRWAHSCVHLLLSLPPLQCRLIKGRLVNLSVDVYIAMELGDGGDLFHLRGQMSGGHCCMAAWLRLLGWPTCNARHAHSCVS